MALLSRVAQRVAVADTLHASDDDQVPADRHAKLARGKKGTAQMRIGLLLAAALALAGFLMVAVVLPQRAGADAKEAAQALIAGVEPAQREVGAAAEKNGSLAGSGRDVKIAARSDPRHGELKWLVSEGGAIRGWNEKNAIEVTFTAAVHGGKTSWTCRGYPISAMPASCGGR
jgi:hypothetical protein